MHAMYQYRLSQSVYSQWQRVLISSFLAIDVDVYLVTSKVINIRLHIKLKPACRNDMCSNSERRKNSELCEDDEKCDLALDFIWIVSEVISIKNFLFLINFSIFFKEWF